MLSDESSILQQSRGLKQGGIQLTRLLLERLQSERVLQAEEAQYLNYCCGFLGIEKVIRSLCNALPEVSSSLSPPSPLPGHLSLGFIRPSTSWGSGGLHRLAAG